VTYIFDANALITLKNFYPARFTTLWTKLDQAVAEGKVLSVREVYNEVTGRADLVSEWAKKNRGIFGAPDANEQAFVAEIFKVPHFQQGLIIPRKQLAGHFAADPFVIAAAKVKNGCVVTQEVLKNGAAKIPNVCEYFGIEHCNLEGFMEKEGWTF
jgi:hypothetical protein